MQTDFLSKAVNFITAMAIAIACMVATPLRAQSPSEFFWLGNNAYKEGNFKKALESYESALDQGNKSAEVYYNAANAAAKLGLSGRAELYYLRAIYISPRFREASANFKLFAKDNSIQIPHERLLNSPISELSVSEWTISTFVFFWIAVGLLVLPPLYGKKHAVWIFLAIIAIVSGLISILALDKWNTFANTAIAMSDDVKMRISPATNAPIAAIANMAQYGQIEKIHGNFAYIRLKNGKCGWAEMNEFEPIVK